MNPILTLCAAAVLSSSAVLADSGRYVGPEGERIESCVRGRMAAAPATTIADLRPGATWACVTLSYFWDEGNGLRRFVENYSRADYRFERAVSGPGRGVEFPRNVLNPAKPVDFTVFANYYQAGVREDLRPGAPHSVDYVVADASKEFLLVERSVRQSEADFALRPGLSQYPSTVLDGWARLPFWMERRAVQYLGCYPADEPARKPAVPCFGDLDAL